MFDRVLGFCAGVPATQLHRYNSLGRIDLTDVLEPLSFALPQRETLPDMDMNAELGRLTPDTQLNVPITDPDPESSQTGPRDSAEESGAGVTEVKSEEQVEETTQDEFSLE